MLDSEGLAATYEYGISGMRERKTVVTEEGTRTTQSVWAGMQLVAELDSDGTRYEYVYGGGIPLELIVTTGGTGATTSRYAYQVDAGGSVIGITDENGDEVARYAYDPYGVPTTLPTPGSLADRNPLRYRGYYFDTETGNYYMPARYYEPRSARFLSVDPAPPEAGDADGLNGYAYCQGDPVQATDPDGREMMGYMVNLYSQIWKGSGGRDRAYAFAGCQTVGVWSYTPRRLRSAARREGARSVNQSAAAPARHSIVWRNSLEKYMEDVGDFKLPYPDRVFTRQTRIGVGYGTVGTDTTYELKGETPVQVGEKTLGVGGGFGLPRVNVTTADVAGTGGSGYAWEGPAIALGPIGTTLSRPAAGFGVSSGGPYIDVDSGLAHRLVKQAWSNQD